MGGKNSLKRTASTSVEHVVEVTAKRRLFQVTSVSHTDIHTKNSMVQTAARHRAECQRYLIVEKKVKINCCWLLKNDQRKRGKKTQKTEHSDLAHGLSQQHLTCFFMPAPCNTKKRNKKRTSQKTKKAKNFGRVPQRIIFLVGNYGLRRAERWEDMPSMSSEVGEI